MRSTTRTRRRTSRHEQPHSATRSRARRSRRLPHRRPQPTLGDAGHDASIATTWIWEGVVAYLTPEEVEASTVLIAARSAPGSRLIVNYQMPSRRATAGQLVAHAVRVLTGPHDPMAGEPRRSSWTPPAMSALLKRYGFTIVADDDLLKLARALPLDLPRLPSSLGSGRVAVADRR